MKKILLTALLPFAITALAAPDAKLTADNALLQELQKNHAEAYKKLEGKTLAEVTPGVNAYLFSKLSQSSDKTFAAYATAFIDSLARLGEKDAKACHAILISSQTPSLFDIQQRLGSDQKKLDPTLAAVLQDKGGWTAPANYSPAAMGEIMKKMQEDLEKNGKKNGLAYTLGGEAADTPEKLKLACQGGTNFFKDLNDPKDVNKITTLRIFLAP